jgi:phosphoenolpyruvate carboxylase
MPPAALPPEVPAQVAMWQARAVLIEDDLLDAVNAVLAAIPDEKTRKLAQAKFEYSSTVRRDDPLLTTVIPQLGKTEAEVDALFIRAAGL